MKTIALVIGLLILGCSNKRIQDEDSGLCLAVGSKDLMVARPIDTITQGDLGNRTHKYLERYLLEHDLKTQSGAGCKTKGYKLVVDLLTLEEVVETGHLLGKVKNKVYYKIKYDAILTEDGEKVWIDGTTREHEKIDEILEEIGKTVAKDVAAKID